MNYITVDQLTFVYDGEPVLEEVSYTLDSSEFVTLTGENGAAKSTLVKASLGILKPQKGSVAISPINIKGARLKIGYLPQQIASFNAGFPSTVHEFVSSGRYGNTYFRKKMTNHDLEHVSEALKAVGMWASKDKRMGELSGGQKQRVVLARLFARDPDVFVLDEPTTGMDEASRSQFYELMHHQAHRHQKAVLMITHDAHDAEQFVDRNIHLRRPEKEIWQCFNIHDKLGDKQVP